MKRSLWVVVLCLFASPALAFKINSGISGSWFNPAKSGHGFSIEVTDQGCTQIDGQGCLLVYWFTYTPEGDPLFLAGAGPIDGNTAELTLGHSSGMRFGSFSPTPPPDSEPWGTINLRFSDCSSGSVSYDSDFVSDEGEPYGEGSFPIRRLADIRDGLCNPAAGAFSGFASYTQPEDASRNPLGLVTTDNRVYFIWASEIDEEMQRVLLTGDLGDVDDQHSATLETYAMLGGEFDNGQTSVPVEVAFDASLREGLSDGTFSGEGGEGSFSMNYDGVFERDASLDRLGSCWGFNFGLASGQSESFGGDVVIEADGTVRADETDRPHGGLTNECRIDGRIEPIAGGFNQYDIDINLNSCSTAVFNGDYRGVAWMRNVGSGQQGRDAEMFFTAHDDRWALIGQGLRRKASSCTEDG